MMKATISKSMRKKYMTEKFFYFLLLFITMIVVAFILGIIIYLIVKGSGAINWEFLSQKPRGGMKEGGIFPAIIGTIYPFIFCIAVKIWQINSGRFADSCFSNPACNHNYN